MTTEKKVDAYIDNVTIGKVNVFFNHEDEEKTRAGIGIYVSPELREKEIDIEIIIKNYLQ